MKFYASLGNHDAREQRYYKLFNMDGKLYYSFKAPKQDVRFIALESTYPVPEQIDVARGGAQVVAGGLEDRLLPPPAVLVGRRTARTSSCARRSNRCS